MKTEIIKTKFLCKSTMREGSIHVFIEGKIYDGEYETWSWEDGYKCNGGWRTYWVTDESGESRPIPRARFRAVFYDEGETRDKRIEQILN